MKALYLIIQCELTYFVKSVLSLERGGHQALIAAGCLRTWVPIGCREQYSSSLLSILPVPSFGGKPYPPALARLVFRMNLEIFFFPIGCCSSATGSPLTVTCPTQDSPEILLTVP